MTTRETPGAFETHGRLGFRLKNGSLISCTCIADDYAADVVDACNNAHEELVNALNCALTEIHNPGAMRHEAIDILEMIDAALTKAKGE